MTEVGEGWEERRRGGRGGAILLCRWWCHVLPGAGRHLNLYKLGMFGCFQGNRCMGSLSPVGGAISEDRSSPDANNINFWFFFCYFAFDFHIWSSKIWRWVRVFVLTARPFLAWDAMRNRKRRYIVPGGRQRIAPVPTEVESSRSFPCFREKSACQGPLHTLFPFTIFILTGIHLKAPETLV